MPGLAMGDCDYGKYLDGPAGRCEDCEGICLSKYGTMKQCARECYDWALEKGYLAVGPPTTCPPPTGLGCNTDWFFLLIPVFFLFVVTFVFAVFAEKRWKISEKLCNSPKLGGQQPVEQANPLITDIQVTTGTGQNQPRC